jgi:glycosyltransferase involved in cell wall biosynthesis
MAKALARRGAAIDFMLPYKAKHPAADEFMAVTPAVDAPPMVDTHGNYIAMGAYSGTCVWCESRNCEHAQEYGSGFVAATHKYADQVERLFRRKNLKPDVIHAHDWLTLEAGCRAKAVSGRPLVVHVHATEFDRAGGQYGNPLIHEIEYQGLQMADRIFAVSQLTKDVLVREYHIPADKIEVVYNSIDPDDLTRVIEATDEYRYVKELKNHGYTAVTYIGRLTVQKGLTYLMDAAALALSRNPKLLFLISGSGEDRDRLIEMSADFGIADRVIFFDFVRGQRWRELYELADIFVMPSVSEPFGLTALEAAHYDTALLLSKQSGVAEILYNTLKFDFWDTRKLADEIINVSLSPALAAELKNNVKREYLNIRWDDVAVQMMDQYEKVMHRHVTAKRFSPRLEASYA